MKNYKILHSGMIVDGDVWYAIYVHSVDISRWIKEQPEHLWIKVPTIPAFDVHEELLSWLVLKFEQ